MLEPILTGLVAAVFVLLTTYLQEKVSLAHWSLPLFILSIGIWNAFVDRFFRQKNIGGDRYDGLADFLIYIHSPVSLVSVLRWVSRTLNSFLFSVCGGIVGVEGVAIEMAHTIRVGLKIHSARWFEQRRRTDVSMGLAAGISAAFHAPFAGVLLPIELGLGGRSLFGIVSAVTAFIAVKSLGTFFSIRSFSAQGMVSSFELSSWTNWLEFGLLGFISALMGAFVVQFFGFIRSRFLKIFNSYAAIGSLLAAGLLVLTYLIYPPGQQPSWLLFENVLKAKFSLNEVGFLFCLELLSLSLILAGFGTMGLFGPVLMLGGMIGFGLHEAFFSAASHLGTTAGLVGGSALLGVVFGAPITGAILVYEMTQDFQILFPCLIAGLVAREFSVVLKIPSLLSLTLQARGHSLLEGRSSDVLGNVKVEQAMVTDFLAVSETDLLSAIRGKILESRYPFLPVVNSRSEFIGLLTIDMVQEGWNKQTSPGSLSLGALLEAKDLLYRARMPTPSLRPNDPLSMTPGLFNDLPCVPVLSDDGKIVGLLFVHNVRLAYDREATRRSLAAEQGSEF